MSNQNPPFQSVLRGLRIRHLMLIDLLCIFVAVWIAAFLRLEGVERTWAYLQQQDGWVLWGLAPLVRLPLYYRLNLYNRLWRYASMHDLRSILLAGALAPILIGIINFILLPWMDFPYTPSRSIWALEGVCSMGFLAATRLALRFQHDLRQDPDDASQRQRKRALIVGAGNAGAMIVREVQSTPAIGLEVVGLIDDDPEKQDSILQGVPILGSRDILADVLTHHQIKQVIIAMPTAPGRVIREVVHTCEAAAIHPHIVPSLHALVNNAGGLQQMRPVEIQDLLRREPVETDIRAVAALLRDERVLVTGGGGSIGSELCRQILHCAPAELVILGHGENSVFEIQQELEQLANGAGLRTEVTVCIADIRMAERVHTLLEQHRPGIIFHTAAHKHVPLMEANPAEAVTNNILGTRNVLAAARDMGVARFVMVSTDKAVNPTSIMGASKRVAELLVMQAAQETRGAYCAVRFGNVLGSRGSVLNTFKQQIEYGGPVTVTHPDVTRYFMTIPEAVQLVLQAAALGQGQEIFMLDMGEPVRIMDLAHDLIRLSGFEVGRDIDIEITGLRPGEKMYEELLTNGETYSPTAHPKLRIAAAAAGRLPPHLCESIAELEQAAARGDLSAIVSTLTQLLPEYQCPGQAVPVTEAEVQQQAQQM